MPLSFLEANKIISASGKLESKKFVLATSGQSEKLDVFLQAHCILNDFICEYTTLPFNTLQQYISIPPETKQTHIFILFPWDILPETDWRTGISSTSITLNDSLKRIDFFLEKLKQFSKKHIIYIPAAILPVNPNDNINQQIELQLTQSLLQSNAIILNKNCFSLSSYLSSGSAFSSKELSTVAASISSLVAEKTTSKKILITDFDNVMWKGVVAEDGLNGIHCDPDGQGFVHYIYQSLLAKFKAQGILIAGITRNDTETALSPFYTNQTLFKADDFVTVIASYHAKSSQIKHLLSELNLPLDSAVFIDDNPLELEEVQTQIPAVSCLQFPDKNEMFPAMLQTLQKYFSCELLTTEDKNRTELYKARYQVSKANTEQGADLTDYLASLDMQLSIQQCDAAHYQRSLQLINKTNQFNLNGTRITDTELSNLLLTGHSLYSFSLKDKFGDHGQIACIVLAPDKTVVFFTMSCRVFQRNIEYAIIHWIIKTHNLKKLKLLYKQTARNIPFKMMIDNIEHSNDNNKNILLDGNAFTEKYCHVLDLFKIDSSK